MNALDLFRYDDREVRVTVIDGEPWFVAADVCAVLEIANSRDALTRLDDDERGVATADTLGGALANSAELSTDMSFSLRDDKRIIAAQDDAASFVASAGAVRGARLEAALQLLRPHLAGDDLQLAQAILAR